MRDVKRIVGLPQLLQRDLQFRLELLALLCPLEQLVPGIRNRLA